MRSFIVSLLCLSFTILNAQKVEDFRLEIDDKEMSVSEALSATNAPGVSYYLDRGEKGRAGFQLGNTAQNGQQNINENTLFQAGAPSASIISFAVLHLVNEGQLELDEPVNHYLKRWKIPGSKVEDYTVRQLLYNRGKFGTPYKPEGFSAGQGLPSLVDILNGAGKAQNNAFKYKEFENTN